MSHDTLSDVLRGVRLRSAVFYFVCGHGTWAAEAPASRDIATTVMPGVDHVLEYHAVTEGECWAGIDGHAPVRLHRGDVLVLPHGDAHVMSSAPGVRAQAVTGWYHHMMLHKRPFRVSLKLGLEPQMGANAAALPPAADRAGATTLVCGFIGCDMRPFNPLIATLPPMLHLPAASGSGWNEQFVRFAADESGQRRPGSEALLDRMSEMMFIDAVRRYVDSLPADSTGWLAGLRDRYVGRALSLLHETPAAAWTMEELGAKVGLSRSALHARFVELVGEPPMQYLAHWRMQLASRLLRETQSTVVSIALEVGYESQAAFTRAFTRMVGRSPAAWRRSIASRPGAGPRG